MWGPGVLLFSLLELAACGEAGLLCRREDSTTEFQRLAPGVSLQGRWLGWNPMMREVADQLDIGADGLPHEFHNMDPGETRIVHERFGCEGFMEYPLAVGQRNQVPIASVLSPGMMGGGRGNDGDYIELMNTKWYEKMLCLAYLRGTAPGAPSSSREIRKTICFEYRSEDDALEIRWYSVDGTRPASPPGKPTSSRVYYRPDANGVIPPQDPFQGERP